MKIELLDGSQADIGWRELAFILAFGLVVGMAFFGG